MRKEISYWLLLAAVILGSCEKPVAVDIPQKAPRLVVNGLLSKGELFEIRIGKSRGVLDPEMNNQTLEEQFTVKTAVPVVFENGTEIDVLRYDPATYSYITTNNKTVREGLTYKIKVSAPGYSDAETFSAIPSQSAIAELRRLKNARTGSSGEEQDEITIKLNDPAGERNFYLIQVVRGLPESIFGTIRPFVFCIYTTDKDVEDHGTGDDPLNPNTCRDGSELLMRDDNFNGATKLLKLYVPSSELAEFTDPLTLETYRPYVVVRRITEDEFKYHRSYKVYSVNSDNPFAEPVNLFSNVKNGYGIFSLSTQAVDTLR